MRPQSLQSNERTEPSRLPVRIRQPRGENAIAFVGRMPTFTRYNGSDGQVPVFLVSQMPAASGPADASHRPSALNATSDTKPEWIRSKATCWPVRTLHT